MPRTRRLLSRRGVPSRGGEDACLNCAAQLQACWLIYLDKGGEALVLPPLREIVNQNGLHLLGPTVHHFACFFKQPILFIAALLQIVDFRSSVVIPSRMKIGKPVRPCH